MTRAQWLIEEEERLIRLDQDLDSVAGSHRAHCEKCNPLDKVYCELATKLSHSRAFVQTARIINQQRQDEEQPLPHYAPVKL